MRLTSWQLVLAGVVLQLLVAVAVLLTGVSSGQELRTFIGIYLVAFVVVAGAAALVPFLLMWRRHHRRVAAVLSVLVAVVFLAAYELTVVTSVLPLCLLGAAILSWREASAARGR